MADTFDYKTIVKAMTDYQTQAKSEVNPLYDMAIQQLQSNGREQQRQSASMAAARGFGSSGLAVDQQNKIMSGVNSEIANQNAQRNAEIARMARSYYESDRNYDLQNRNQQYGEWSDNRNFDYQKSRDGIADNQWQQKFNLRKKGGSGRGGGGGRNYNPYVPSPKGNENPLSQLDQNYLRGVETYFRTNQGKPGIGLGTLPGLVNPNTGNSGYALKMKDLIY